MQERVVAALPGMSLVESVALMERKHVPTLFVVDEERHLLGHVDVEDIQRCSRAKGTHLSDISHTQVPSVKPEDSAKETFARMMQEHLDVLPVTDGENRLVGIVTRSSMVKSLARAVWREDGHG